MMIINDFFFFSLENDICIRIIQNFYRRILAFVQTKSKKIRIIYKFICVSVRRLIVLDSIPRISDELK
jgi:hypothetical protein